MSSNREELVKKFQAAAKILKVISHPVRLEILRILENEEPLDVKTICEKIGSECELSMLSHHLAKMKDNNILKSNKKGKQVFYSIVDKQILKVFECVRNCNI